MLTISSAANLDKRDEEEDGQLARETQKDPWR